MRSAVSGAALIVVIFVIMLFGILGWSLAVMQSSMFAISARTIAPEQALNIAEAGARWGINTFIASGEMSSSDGACDSESEWATHNLTPGQYQVCTRSPQTGEAGSVVIESVGYVPGISAYQAKRRIKIMASVGSFSKTVIARNLFNWTGADKANSYVTGAMLCAYYEANGNNVYNEEGIDYSNNASGLLPKTNKSEPARRDTGSSLFPEIDMGFYETNPDAIVLAPAMTSVISNVTQSGGDTRIVLAQSGFFGQSPWARWTGQALRNISRGAWKSGTWKDIKLVSSQNTALLNGTVDWLEGERVTLEPRIATDPVFNSGQHTYTFNFNGTLAWPAGQAIRNFSLNTWQYRDWGVIESISSVNNVTTVTVKMDNSITAKSWQQGHWIGYVRRFTSADTIHGSGGLLFNGKLLYIESDVLFDTRADDINTKGTGIVVEGDAVIRGARLISLEKKPLLFPNLATKNGNIYSPDLPAGNNINQRLAKRTFDDIIYSENGDVVFNYVDCQAMYGSNITLSGVFQIKYDPQLTQIGGYAFGLSGMSWQEQ